MSKESISIILNVYKRFYTLDSQIKSILNQSVNIKEEDIHIWINTNENGFEDFKIKYDKIKFYHCNYNTKFFGRFTIPLLCKTEYVAVFDDDILPGKNWLKNCLDSIKKQDGIYGGSGIITNGKTYVPHTKVGWNGVKSNEITKVDLVGHAWFFRQEHAKFMWLEEIPSWDNGEDIFFSYVAQKNGIDTYVPPHSKENISFWSNISGSKWGSDENAHYLKNENHLTIRNQIVSTLIDKGWKTVKNV
jgi:hypothetical protein